MRLELHQPVSLLRDLPEHGLKQGDTALIVDYALHEGHGELAYILETVSASGETALVTKTIGISTADLKTALKGGQTPAQVAQAHKVDPQTVITTVVNDITTKAQARAGWTPQFAPYIDLTGYPAPDLAACCRIC